MPIDPKYLSDFCENGIYHIYNRTNNKERLFLSDDDKSVFFEKYDRYLTPFIDTYAWSLLPNHFHLLNRVKSISSIEANLSAIPFKELVQTEKKFLEGQISLSKLIQQSFKRFFQSYAIHFNNSHLRKGNLFYRPFKRIEVCKESQFTKAIVYIHANAKKHQLVEDFSEWGWSSWQTYLSDSPTRLLREEVLEWFGGRELFIKTHEQMIEYYYQNEISIED